MDRIYRIKKIKNGACLKIRPAACFPSSPPFSQAEKGAIPLSHWERVRVKEY
jgi:hypothetical protein